MLTIRFVVNNVFNGWMPDDDRLGGTEDAVVQWAYILSQHSKVQVFSNFRAQNPFNYLGARYLNKQEYLAEAGQEEGVTVFVNEYRVSVVEPSIYLTNETDADRHDLREYEWVIQPTQWAIDNIKVNQKTKLIPYGYHPDRIKPARKIPKQCLYASSPDRGLDTLAIIWPEIVKEHPDAQLIVTYGGRLDAPNTTCVGSITEDQMDRLYSTSDIWLHPCNGGELYGISGVKAQAAGAIPVYFPVMALQETVRDGVACENPRDMYKKLVALLGNENEKDAIRERLMTLEFPTWESTAQQLIDVIIETWTTRVK